MGFFDRLKQKSDNFFDGLQQNAIDNALAAAEKNNQKVNTSDKNDDLEKYNEWYNTLSEEDKIEEDYKKWKSKIGYNYESTCVDLLMKRLSSALTPLEKKIVDVYMKPATDALEKERIEKEKVASLGLASVMIEA